MCIEALKYGIKKVIVPKKNVLEASCVEGLKVIGVSNLQEVIDYLNWKIDLKEEKFNTQKILKNEEKYNIDFNEVKGQAATKRALEIAVAGNHNAIMIGNPGSRKNNDGKENCNNLARYDFWGIFRSYKNL